MRARVIAALVKEDIYQYRRLIYASLLTPWLLGLFLLWQKRLVYDLFRQYHFSDQAISTFAFAILFAIPFMAIWLGLVARLGKEAKQGYYAFSKILPVTLTEMVTAKCAIGFFGSMGAAGWLYFCWYVCGSAYANAGIETVWSGLLIFGLFFPACLGLHHGAFFKTGAYEPWHVHVLLIAVIFLSNQHFVARWLTHLSKILMQTPDLTIGVGTICVLAVWLLSWERVLAADRKNPIQYID